MAGLNYSVLAIAPIVGLVTYVLINVLVSRARQGRNQVICHAAGVGGGLLLQAVVTLVPLAHTEVAWSVLGYLAINLVTYLCLAACYMIFVNLSVTSLRMRMLREIAGASHGLSDAEILSRYGAEVVIEKRLDRLVQGGHLVVDQGRYYVGQESILYLYFIFQIMKFLVLGRGYRVTPCEDFSSKVRMMRDTIRATWRSTFIRFLVVGGVNTLFSYVLYAALVLAGIDYRLTVTICSVATTLWNFNTTGRLVFRDKRKRLILKFATTGAIIYVINLLSLMFLVGTLGLGKLVSQTMLHPCMVVIAFLLNRNWVYREANRAVPAAGGTRV